MTPSLKQLHRKMKREYFHHRKSPKWKKLRMLFKKKKKITIRKFYSEIVNNLKQTNPSRWYTIAKKLENNYVDYELEVESIKDLSNEEASEAIDS